MGKAHIEELKIQNLLGRYLQSRSITAKSQSHLDEDFINAFVEGRLNPAESTFVLKHLIDCSFCLHITSEIARLEHDFADEEVPGILPVQKPEKISDVLNGLLSKIFGTSDGAVFAHQEDKEEENKEN